MDETVWGTKPKTSYTCDALGREEQRTNPDSTTVRTDYDGWKTAVLDEKNHQTIYERDAYGRLVKVKEYEGTYTTRWGARLAWTTPTWGRGATPTTPPATLRQAQGRL